MIYKKEKNLFLMLILSSLFLKLFYAADENKYNDLINRAFVEPTKGFTYPQYILKNEIKKLAEKQVEEKKNPYELYGEISSIYDLGKMEGEHNRKEDSDELKKSFVYSPKMPEIKPIKNIYEDQLRESLKESILTLERDSLEKMYHLFLDFFHNVYFENTYKKYFSDEDKKNASNFLEKIYSFLKDYFQDYRDFRGSIASVDDDTYQEVNRSLPFLDKYSPKKNMNSSIEYLFTKFEGIDSLFRLIFLEYISLRQVLEGNGVPLDRLKNEYGFKQMNAMKESYTQEFTYTKDTLLALNAQRMRAYTGWGLIGLSAGLGMYDFAHRFFFRNGNFFLLDGFYEIKRLTVNDVKNGIVDICKEPRQNKAKMGMFLCGGIGVLFGTRNFILQRKKEKLERIVKNLDFSELFKNKVSEKMEKKRKEFLEKKKSNEIQG